MTEEIIQKKYQINDQWLCSQLCCISTTAKNIFIFNTWKLMLCIHQFGSLETWITTIQILSIYGKNQPKTKLKHAAQNNKLSALSSAEIYRMVQLNQHEWHTDTCRHKMWVGILEHKNVGYKSICIPGKVNNGLLNDLFQVYVYSPVFFPWRFQDTVFCHFYSTASKSILWTATIMTKCL